MLELSLQELFGDGATQTSQLLVIKKSDLPGLTTSANNRAEQLLVALLLKVQEQFEGILVDEIGDIIVDETGDAVSYDNSELYTLTVFYWRKIFVQKNNRLYLSNQFVVFSYAQTD